jgi:VanZ family protein
MKSFPKLKFFIKYWLPFLLWAVVIFSFSANPTRPSSEIHWQDFIIKKTAHIIEYAVFTTLLYRALRKVGYDIKKAGYTALAIAFLYGTTDEYHQSFTPGREPTIRDILFDTLGSGIAIYLIWNYLSIAPDKIKKLAKKLELF